MNFNFKIFYLLIAILVGTVTSYGLSITDNVTINYGDDPTGTTLITYFGHNGETGENEYCSAGENSDGSLTYFNLNVTSVTGDPEMIIVMYNPNNTDEFWAASASRIITEGLNSVGWGPHADPIYLRYIIKLDSDDSITFDEYSTSSSMPEGANIDPSPSLSIDTPFTIDFTNGISPEVDNFDWIGYVEETLENHYAFTASVPAGSGFTFDVNASNVVGDPKMYIYMYNPANTNEFWEDPNGAPSRTIVDGENSIRIGLMENDVHLKFVIALDADDELDVDSLDIEKGYKKYEEWSGSAGNSIEITESITIDYDNGITGGNNEFNWTGWVESTGDSQKTEVNMYQYAITTRGKVNFEVNVTDVQGSPRMILYLANPFDYTDSGSGNFYYAENQFWATGNNEPKRTLTEGTNIINWGPFDGARLAPHYSVVCIKATFELEAGESVTVDNIRVVDDTDVTFTGPPPDNGVRFTLEQWEGEDPAPAAYYFDTAWAEIQPGDTVQNFELFLPERNHNEGHSSIVMKVIGDNQPYEIYDVQIHNDGNTYGSIGDGLVFDRPYQGALKEDGQNVYTLPSGATGGFMLSTADKNTLPQDGLFFTDGNSKITFKARFSDASVELPPDNDGESAISNGIIDLSPESGSGLIAEGEDPYRWTAYANFWELDGNNGKDETSYVAGDDWGFLSDLSATWDGNVLILTPNTASFDDWGGDEGLTDGNKYVEQILKIEGDAGTSDILGKTVNFTGTVSSYTLDPRYIAKVFIKTLDSNNDEVDRKYETLDSTGNFAISCDLAEGAYKPSLGFVLEGRNNAPGVDRGDIRLTNLSATYGDTLSVPNGGFTGGADGAWTAYSAQFDSVEFNDNGGNGPVPGQVVFTHVSNTHKYNNYALSSKLALSNFGMEAGNTYNVTYDMNSISGNGLGSIQIGFWDEYDNLIGYFPNTYDANGQYEGNVANGQWLSYSQEIDVPSNAVTAQFVLYSGGEGSVIAYDNIDTTVVEAANFSNWASSHGLSGSNIFSSDSDGDGISNGLESYLGTDPAAISSGMSNITKTSDGISMQHPVNSESLTDVSASYKWSTDLVNWTASGVANGGTTVTITPQVTNGIATATGSVTGEEPERMFIKLEVSNSN